MGSSSSFSAMNIAIYISFGFLFTLWTISVLCRRYRPFNRLNVPALTPSHPVTRPQVVVLGVYPTNQNLPRGLDASTIDTFPKFRYEDEKKGNNNTMKMTEKEECGVCLCVLDGKEMVRLLPKCGHVFHADCVDPWLGSHATCPLCRANLLPAQMAHRAQYRVDVEGQSG